MAFNQEAYDKILISAKKLATEKYSGYGGDNILMFGDFGCLVRANDKLQRLKVIYNRMMKTGCSEEKALENSVPDEKIDDDILDAINYLVYMRMCRRGEWE